MVWDNIIFTILGGLISGLVGLFIEWWRERIRLKKKHFKDIKRKCLKPILEGLHDLRKEFEFREGGPEWDLVKLRETLKSEFRWWEFFSFKRYADTLLYEDLRNHFPDLYQELQNIELWVKNEFMTYLQSIYELLKLIDSDPEFKEFIKGFHNQIIPLKAVLFSSLGVDKSEWPNIYLQVKHKLNELIYLQNKFYNSVETQKVREITNHMIITIDRCIKRIEEILLETKLRGKCKYL